jgi:predicted DNA-binding protein YlxM (UPF0122 family)
MTKITDFHPTIQSTIRFLSGQKLQEIAGETEVTKQAIHKKVQKGIEYLEAFGSENEQLIPKSQLNSALKEQKRLLQQVQHLRRELILAGAERQLLRFFKAKVLEFFPRFKPGSLPVLEKKTDS